MKKLETEVVIIGSGVGGSVCGYQLAKKGVKVIIVEAGKHLDRHEIIDNFRKTDKLDFSAGYPNSNHAPRPDWGADNDDYIKQTGPKTAKIEYLRAVGGTTWHWEGACIRYAPIDFKLKTAYGIGYDWPINYDTLEPYYTKAEKEIGVAGDHTLKTGSPRSKPYPFPALPKSYADKKIEEKLKNIGINFVTKPIAINSSENGDRPQCVGFGTCTPICPSGALYNGSIHAKKAEENGALLLDNTRIDKIESDKDGKITSIIGEHIDGEKIKIKAKYFVVAANGIESAKLLLMSKNKYFPKGLANKSGMVGRNFYDHLGISVTVKMPENVYSGRGPTNKIVSYDFRDNESRSDSSGWILTVDNNLKIHDLTNKVLNSKVKREDLAGILRDNVKRQVTFSALVEQLPDHKNGIELDWDDLDRAGNPRIKLHYSIGKYEEKSFEEIRKTFSKITETLGAEIIHYSEPHPHHHLMGTTIMGKHPSKSVVNEDCRTHDHPNLYISSSATFPSGSIASPTLTIASLALKIADNIYHKLN